ncbi:60S ribosomal protein L15 (nucleomorph) [Cryptomonas paramecium]|uniref:Ribosomal protein L15 n=1 Tax=Cryptomonas paramaecium TaxID=2898 RepID=F2HIC9_9CRYP|nr:60S ribosomal protein L15 [Cryptomonas paramecium]AEA39053.1 60S ribosomal protein L15 [Cryptomonas paramecium]
MKGNYFVNELWRKKQSDVMSFLFKIRCWEYRHYPSIYRIKTPSRPEKAKKLGYKSKKGFVIYRVRVRRGNRKTCIKSGIVHRKPKNQGITQIKFKRNKQSLAEERTGKVCPNLRILNSYWLNQDSIYKYFEIICIDPVQNSVRNTKKVKWICKEICKHRELRGLTSCGKKYRGLRKKGHRASKIRPSVKSSWRRNNTLSLRRYR